MRRFLFGRFLLLVSLILLAVVVDMDNSDIFGRCGLIFSVLFGRFLVDLLLGGFGGGGRRSHVVRKLKENKKTKVQ